ncbi:MAG: hypothetical protein B7Z78_02545 [Rhodospirillales bacterium 20-60-12]|nr:MAG: hypothetical protein B7Z78_02545 [Rhodospirillales bacterium 20-60-12]HQT66587.1 cytochrome c [Acetobacteraceae bacterium]
MVRKIGSKAPIKTILGIASLMVVLGAGLGTRLAFGTDAPPAPASAPPAATPAPAQAASGAPATAPAPTTPASPLADQLARGKYLVAAADCMPCHSGPGHAPYTGGLPFKTPFGVMYSPNITPDKATGIGNWTDKQFYTAIHDGISPGHSFLIFPKYIYPAMPYTSYSQLTYNDVMAMKAYIFSLTPVSAPHVPNALNFPFNLRPILLGWRILFFHPHAMKYDASWSANVRNGAYLTEALGHCTECHSPRNIFAAIKSGDTYAGAPIDSWYAPNISSSKRYGVGAWSQGDLVSYLHDGGNIDKGSAYGSMRDVVTYSLSQLPVSDVQDIATYLQTITTPRDTPPSPSPLSADDLAAQLKTGGEIYAQNCAGCHQATGKGMMTLIPALAGNGSVTAAAPTNVIGAVVLGLEPWNHGPPMPAFGSRLNNDQIAAVANYVRTSMGNDATANATPDDVQAIRDLNKK